MKLPVKVLIVLNLLSSLSFGQFHNTNFDFSSINIFWSIVDELKINKEPSEDLWNKLFSTPGYSVLTISEFSKDFFKEKFRQAFSSRYSAKYLEEMKNPRAAYYLNHYKKVFEKKSELQQQINKLKSSNLNKQVLDIVLNYLPMNSADVYPDVAFIIFANDGRGYNPIVIDLYATIDWDYITFLAHEYHHWYRNRFYAIDYSIIHKEDKPLFEILSQLEAEGIADQIDKKNWFQESSKNRREELYINLVSDSPSIINKMNSILEEISDNRYAIEVLGEKLKSVVPLSGHPTGYFMAKTILDALGRSELIKTVGNPFSFIKQYNNAARIKGSKDIFSSKAIKIIDQLERLYILE